MCTLVTLEYLAKGTHLAIELILSLSHGSPLHHDFKVCGGGRVNVNVSSETTLRRRLQWFRGCPRKDTGLGRERASGEPAAYPAGKADRLRRPKHQVGETST